MCKGCNMKIGTEAYLKEILPLGESISQAFANYEKAIKDIPEMDSHHKAVVRLRKQFNEELNSWEPKSHWVCKTYTGNGIPNSINKTEQIRS